jgi:D-methionine transport system permease protein
MEFKVIIDYIVEEFPKMLKIVSNPIFDTLFMVFLAGLFSTILGSPIGILLVVTKEGNILENKRFNKLLQIIINTFRSIPFIILMVCLMPLTRMIIGTTIGRTAAIVPLSISAAPFVARMIEGALNEVDKGLIEASSSMGASPMTIILKVMIPETLPHIVHGLTVTIISLLGFSAMAGAIGAGGLGDLAIRYGYQRFKTDIMIYAVIVIIALVQIIQMIGNILVYRIKKNR